MDEKEFNLGVKNWARRTFDDLKRSFDKYDIKHRKNSKSSTAALKLLRNRIGYTSWLANKVSFKFPKHLIYVHKGVGKGVKVADQPMSNRRAKPWFNDTMDKRLDELADVVAENAADLVLNATHMKIK